MTWKELPYAPMLEFSLDCLDQLHVDATVLEYPYKGIFNLAFGYYRLLNQYEDLLANFQKAIVRYKPNTIYRVSDQFLCHYLLFRLPNSTSDEIMIIGPYLMEAIDRPSLLSIISRFNFPPAMEEDLKSYYDALPLFLSDDVLVGLLNVLGKHLWGDLENFTFCDTISDYSFAADFTPASLFNYDAQEPSMKIAILKQRYDLENELLSAISKGHAHQAEIALTRFFSGAKIEPRNHDPLRNDKNYMIILNTLFRKAAERGYVHPLHLDRLSSQLAIRIEQFESPFDPLPFAKEMVRKYTLLVKNYSLREYSDLTRSAQTLVMADLTANLSLKEIAHTLSVNASYLSSQFKKEMGITLTEYVTQKRIEQAIFMLNSTTLPISDVAQFCGIPDVQYFSKVFKKQIGKAPSEYRKMLSD